MAGHWRYLMYVLRHKWYVWVAGRRLGVGRWQLFMHDMSKFRPDEWFPYVLHFYGTPIPDGVWHGDVRNIVPYEHTESGSLEAFDVAWLMHIHRNPHHWQHWVLREDDGGVKVLDMPRRYVMEMVADWVGAGRAQGKDDVVGWYRENMGKMELSSGTRELVHDCVMEFASVFDELG